MGLTDPAVAVGVQLLLAAAAAMGLAALLRRSGAPGGRHGSAAVGGLVAGVLLGPAVLGAVAPGLHDRVFVGAADERAELAALADGQAREAAALRATGVSEIALTELTGRHAEARAPLEVRLARAEERFASIENTALGAVVAAYLVAAGALVIPMRRAALRRLVGELTRSAPAPKSVLAGPFAFVAAAIIPAAVGGWVLRLGPGPSLALGASLAAPAVAASLRPRDWWPALAGAGLAFVVALFLAAGTSAAMLMMGFGAIVMWLVPLAAGGGAPPRRVRRTARSAALGMLLPTLLALAGSRVDPATAVGAGAFWAAGVAAVLLAADGRWLAWVLAWRALGSESDRDRIWARGGRAVSAGTGFVTAALAAGFHAGGLLPGPALAGLLLGVLAIECTRGLRERLAPVLDSSPLGSEGPTDATFNE